MTANKYIVYTTNGYNAMNWHTLLHTIYTYNWSIYVYVRIYV